MIKIPTSIIIDGFYNNPTSVRNFVLGLPFAKSSRTNYPGERTGNVEDVAPHIYEEWKTKFLQIFAPYYSGDWEFSTQFQMIPASATNPLLNEGWAHADVGFDVAGVIYLNPEPHYESGTAILMGRDGRRPQANANISFRNAFYGGRNNVSEEDFIKAKSFHNSKFQNDITVSNQFNRLMTFDCTRPHKQSGFGVAGEPRLTQVFFARMIKDIE